jgi:hypothetical protein
VHRNLSVSIIQPTQSEFVLSIAEPSSEALEKADTMSAVASKVRKSSFEFPPDLDGPASGLETRSIDV